MAQRIDHSITKGDTYTIKIEVTNASDGTAIDVSALSFWFTVKTNLYDADVSAVLQKEGVDFSTSANLATCVLSASDTKITPGTYWYDIQFKDGANIVTPIFGKLIINSEVTYGV